MIVLWFYCSLTIFRTYDAMRNVKMKESAMQPLCRRIFAAAAAAGEIQFRHRNGIHMQT